MWLFMAESDGDGLVEVDRCGEDMCCAVFEGDVKILRRRVLLFEAQSSLDRGGLVRSGPPDVDDQSEGAPIVGGDRELVPDQSSSRRGDPE